MDSNSDLEIDHVPQSKWEICYAEACRRVDHQIREIERLEDQSLFILRILVGIIGMILTAISITASTGTLFNIRSSLTVNNIERISHEVAIFLPVLGENQAELVSFLLFFTFVGFGTSSVVNLFIDSPKRAYNVLEPRIFEPSSDATKMAVFYSENVSEENIKHSLVSEYSDIAESNREALQKAREEWEHCYSALKTGTTHFGVSILFILSAIVIREPEITAVLLLGVIMWLPVKFDMRKLFTNAKNYLVTNLLIDAPILTIFFAFLLFSPVVLSSLISSLQFLFMVIFASLVLLFIPISTNMDEHRKLAVRTGSAGIILLSIGVILDAATSDRFWLDHRALDEVLFIAMLTLLIAAILLGISFNGRRYIRSIRNSSPMN